VIGCEVYLQNNQNMPGGRGGWLYLIQDISHSNSDVVKMSNSPVCFFVFLAIILTNKEVKIKIFFHESAYV